MRDVIGVDGCRDGWVVVRLVDGALADLRVVARLTEVLDPLPDVVALDIPIGLVDAPRAADGAARRALPGRASSVFSAPARCVVDGYHDGSLTDHAAATARSVDATGGGLSMQAWRLVAKIAEVDQLVGTVPARRLLEVHPELAFTTLLGQVPPRKTSWPGLAIRRTALREVGIDLPDRFPGDLGAAPDDVVDAAVCAWVADGRAAGEALLQLPEDPDQHDRGRPLVIVARRPGR